MAPSAKSHKGNKSTTSTPAVSPHSVTPDSKGQKETTAKTSPVDKDARAYDHERQRLKKAADFVKARALKKYSRPIQTVTSGGTKYRGGGGVDTRKSSGFASMKAKASRFWMTEDTEDLDSLDMDDRNHYEYEGKGSREQVPSSNDNDNDNSESTSDVKVKTITDTTPDLDSHYQPPHLEVKLADLVTKGNNQLHKSKRDNGFEVIPHIRSVIVLDDTYSNDLDMDMELLDETWEYICASDDEPDNKGLSYAQIAALAK